MYPWKVQGIDLVDSHVSQEYILSGPGRLICIPGKSRERTWQTYMYPWEVQGMDLVDPHVSLGGLRNASGGRLTHIPKICLKWTWWTYMYPWEVQGMDLGHLHIIPGRSMECTQW